MDRVGAGDAGTEASGAGDAGAAGALFYHGGDLGAARRVFPDAPLPWIDLSTGINPVPYPVAGLPETDWTRLPDPAEAQDLCRVAAAAYGLAGPACVAAAPGTQALLQWLPRLMPARRVAILGFTYAEHGRCWAAAGAEVSIVPEPADLAGFDVAVVVNPNNPDGRLLGREALLGLAREMARRGGRLIVDEAFADVLPAAASVAPFVGEAGNLVVLRSFGKTYGLPGARLGFALAAPGLAASLREALGPWAVCGPAVTLGRRALADRDWLAGARTRLAADAGRLAGLLSAAGMRPLGGTPLYVFAEAPGAHALFRRLGTRGVLVRAFADGPDRLRVGLPAPSAWPDLEARLAGL